MFEILFLLIRPYPSLPKFVQESDGVPRHAHNKWVRPCTTTHTINSRWGELVELLLVSFFCTLRIWSSDAEEMGQKKKVRGVAIETGKMPCIKPFQSSGNKERPWALCRDHRVKTYATARVISWCCCCCCCYCCCCYENCINLSDPVKDALTFNRREIKLPTSSSSI